MVDGRALPLSGPPSIVCAGYTPLDIVRTPTGLAGRRAGGTAANVAAILAFLGWNSTLAGQVGADRAGDELVADLAAVGVSIDQLKRVNDAQTARLVHDVRPEGHFFNYRCPECGSRFPRNRPLTLQRAEECAGVCPSPTVFFFDRANAGTLFLAETYAQAGSVVVFEPSVPANAELLARAVSVADVVKHSDDRSVGGLPDLHLRARKGQVRIVTHGAEGLEVRVGSGRPRRIPALATLAVDTGGAGDWATAGFLARAARAQRIDPDVVDDALRFGQALAAVNCATVGARGLMRLKPEAARRRARRVLVEGGLTREPRVRTDAATPAPKGLCRICLMPLADQLSLDELPAFARASDSN